MSRKYLAPALVSVVLLGVGLFVVARHLGWFEPDGDRPFGPGPFVAAPDDAYSNILPDDYVGPAACRECHATQHRQWSSHPHRLMNQLVSPAVVKGDFADHVWKVRDGVTVTFATRGGDHVMEVESPARPATRYKVTRTVGSRAMQFYIGVQTAGPEPADDRVYTTEHKLPFGYWFRLKRWLPVDDFDVTDDNDETLRDGVPVVRGVDRPPGFVTLSRSCLHCHNTYPEAYRLYRPRLNGLWDARVEAQFGALRSLLASRVAVDPNEDDFAAVADRLDSVKDLVTVGISCESCHLGGREHAARQKKIAFHPANPHVRVAATEPARPYTGERANPATSRSLCAQCHSATVEHHPNGAAIRNSAESKDLAAGSCLTQISCVHCHDPHVAGPPSGGPTLAAHLDACTKCHPRYASPEQAAAHSRHAAGVDCLDCHMPRVSHGLDAVVHTHKISPPVEATMVTTGSLNACNLCHLDRSVGWTLDELHRGWGRDLRGLAVPKRDEPAGPAWLAHPAGSVRLAATDAYTRLPAGKAEQATALRSLNDPNPTVRAFAVLSLERVLGRVLPPAEIDLAAAPAKRAAQIEAIRASLGK